MEEEIWKGVIYQGIDYSWRFECSNLGRIRNAQNKHIYIPHICGIGYYQICTCVNGINKNIKVHKAVAETFLPNPDGLRDVNHKDGNKLNNNLDNLEWVSHRDNTMHAFETGLNSFEHLKGLVKKGEDNNLAKLTWENVKYIREHYHPSDAENCYGNIKILAEMFNVTKACIYSIINGKTWKEENKN